MNKPSFGSFAAVILVAVGLGGWVLNDAVADVAPTTPVAQPANPPPIEFMVAPPPLPPPAPIQLFLVQSVPGTAQPLAGQDDRGDGSATAVAWRVGEASASSAPPRGRAPVRVSAPPARGAAPSGRVPTQRFVTPIADAESKGTSRRKVAPVATGTATTAEPVTVRVVTAGPGGTRTGDSYQILATNGSIVYVGPNGELIANTGATSSSGVVALGVDHSTVETGESTEASHANGSFDSLLNSSNGSTAISGFEDHSVSVIGDDQIVTYDDSNVFIARNGQINANTGDTDSSGLNAVDVIGSRVQSGNSGDGESTDDEDQEEADEDQEEADEDDGSEEAEKTAAPPARSASAPTGEAEKRRSSADGSEEEAAEEEAAREEAAEEEAAKEEAAEEEAAEEEAAEEEAAEEEAAEEEAAEEEAAEEEAAEEEAPTSKQSADNSHATVTDEGASEATGPDALVVGADGYDDVSIRSRGDGNIVTYDDSNVVIGGTGDVNAQVGDSDTGGAVVMGVKDSDVKAGCEGDLCD